METEEGTEMVKMPSEAVCVAVLAPFTVTIAFANGLPSESVTFPVTILFCEKPAIEKD